MALTDKEKTDILFHLGWPLKSLLPGSTHYNKIAVDRMNNLTSPMEDRVRELLCNIEEVRSRLLEAQKRLSASRVDTIELNQDEIDMLKVEMKRLSKELSGLLDLEMLKSSGANISLCQ